MSNGGSPLSRQASTTTISSAPSVVHLLPLISTHLQMHVEKGGVLQLNTAFLFFLFFTSCAFHAYWAVRFDIDLWSTAASCFLSQHKDVQLRLIVYSKLAVGEAV